MSGHPSGGYVQSVLSVDLGTGRIRAEPLDPELARRAVGGLGFGTERYLELVRDGPLPEPLSPSNPFILMTGPLTGLRMHGVARWTVCSRSPLTGFWGEANVGGWFGAELKFAGYDGIVLTGAAASPVSLWIENGRAELRDARSLWGKDTYETTDTLVRENAAGPSGTKSGQVLAIGPAGERRVAFASLLNAKGHAAGRTGMGAVWGSKNLKAIFVRGTGKIRVAHEDRLAELKRELEPVYRDSITIEALRTYGTSAHMDVGIIGGDIPMKNWLQTDWDRFNEIGPLAYGEKIFSRRRTCFGCGVSCKREAEVKEGPYRMEKGPGPEYETVAAFGTMCLNPSLESIAKANEICNRYGMDTISCGSTIAFAIECFEKGLIDERDTGGLRLGWGEHQVIVKLTEQIGRQEGFGEILGQGSARAAQIIGGGAEQLVSTVKGLEAPMHDPRGSHGYGLAYAVAPRGACHMSSANYSVEGGGMVLPEIPECAGDIAAMSSVGKAGLNVACQDFGVFFGSCAVYCFLGAMVLNATQAVAMVNHVTGFDFDLEEAMAVGRRVWYLKRGLANLFGARAEHDRLPPRLMSAVPDGPTAGSVPDMELMLREFSELRGLRPDGIPRGEVLRDLGLGVLADRLDRI